MIITVPEKKNIYMISYMGPYSNVAAAPEKKHPLDFSCMLQYIELW